MARSTPLLSLVGLLAVACVRAAAPVDNVHVGGEVVEVLLFGPYSNLAKKYLWQSFLQLWDTSYPASLHVVAAGRDAPEVGTAKIRDMVTGHTTCGAGASASACDALRLDFLDVVTYVQIRDAAGYAHLGSVLSASSAKPGFVGRLTYFSVDTGLVPSMLRHLRVHGGVSLRHPGPLDPFSRVIVEKPLGNDGASCKHLVSELRAELSGGDESGGGEAPDALLVMDHYLGKTGLRMAYEGRRCIAASHDWSEYLSAEAGHSELVVLEDETAEGRTGFFNGVGALRDMLQSHASLFIAAATGPPGTPWNMAHRLSAWSRVFPESLVSSPLQYWNDGAPEEGEGGYDPHASRRKRQPSAPWSRFVRRNASEAVAHSVRLVRYEGYPDHVAADRAPGGRGAFSYNVTHGRWCTLEAARAKKQRTQVPPSCVGTSALAEPGPYDLYGPGYRGLTGFDFTLEVGDALMDVRIGKAAGTRTGYFRHTVKAVKPLLCGPVTITFHMQGRVMLPPGVNHSDPGVGEDKLPHGSPAIIITGVCPPLGLAPPVEALLHTEHGWPHDWSVTSVPSAGVWWTTPRLTPWTARRLKPKTPSASSESDDVTTLVQRMAGLASTPGRAGGDAYTSMIASAIAGETGGFTTTGEAQALWDLWTRVIQMTDAAAAGPLVGHAAALAAAKRAVASSDGTYSPSLLTPLDDPSVGSAEGGEDAVRAAASSYNLPALPPVQTHGVGDSSWLRLLRRPSISIFDEGDTAARSSILLSDPMTSKFVGRAFPPPPFKEDGTVLHAPPHNNPDSLPYLAVRGTDASGHVLDKFASDLVTLVWFSLNAGPGTGDGRPPHIAFDHDVSSREDGGIMDALYERLAEDDSVTLTPWPAVHFWSVREVTTRSDVRECVSVALHRRLAVHLRFDPSRQHAPSNPDVSMLNRHSRRILTFGSFDAVVLHFPEVGPAGSGNVSLGDVAAGHPVPLGREHASPWAVGDDEADVYVSTGLGVGVAGEWVEDPLLSAYDPPRTVEVDALLRGLGPLPAPHSGRVDVRLSRAALKAARQVLVAVSRSTVEHYAGLEAEEAGRSAAVGVGADGGQDTGRTQRLRGDRRVLYADPVPGEPAYELPAPLAADIQRLAGGRATVIRVYVV